MGVVDSISDTAVMNTLKKTNLSPGRKKWCIPKAEARRIAVRLEILRASAGSCFLAEYGGNRDRYSVKAMSGSTDNVL